MKEFIITEKEFIQAYWISSKTNLIKKKWKFITAEIILIIVAFFVSYLPNMPNYVCIGLILFIPIILLCILVSFPWELKRLYKNNPNFSMPKKVSWDDEFINTHTQFLESKFPWKNFITVLDNSDLILLYESSNFFSIYPKRAFDNKKEMEEFLSLSRRSIAIQKDLPN